MAYFHCLIGGGSSGGGYELTVTCDSVFSGTTITCTDGVTTLTATCPSASPYEVVFEIPNGGDWTVSGTISGSTYTASIDIPDSLELLPIPEGSTVLPTDDIQTWLACSNIFDKSYTTLNEVLADSTTLLALMSNNNAVDYLVRSTTWASGVTANSTAMTDIGANNYCANTLLADSTWLNAICDSTYFESVLNVKVPTMTSNTTPSGQCFGSYTPASGFTYYKSFDGDDSTLSNPQTNQALGYKFTQSVKVKRVYFKNYTNTNAVKTFKIQGSNDGSTWTDVTDVITSTSQGASGSSSYNFINNVSYEYYRIYVVTTTNASPNDYANMVTLQFYGRVDV